MYIYIYIYIYIRIQTNIYIYKIYHIYIYIICIYIYIYLKITLPEHPTCENLISVSASKACCVQRVLGTGGITKPTGPRRGATMQSPHFVDTREFI